MEYVVLGTGSGRSMEEIMEVYPRHRAFIEGFVTRGEIVGAGPFADGDNMAIFNSHEAATQFAAADPFLLEGVITSYEVRPWNATMW